MLLRLPWSQDIEWKKKVSEKESTKNPQQLRKMNYPAGLFNHFLFTQRERELSPASFAEMIKILFFIYVTCRVVGERSSLERVGMVLGFKLAECLFYKWSSWERS